MRMLRDREYLALLRAATCGNQTRAIQFGPSSARTVVADTQYAAKKETGLRDLHGDPLSAAVPRCYQLAG